MSKKWSKEGKTAVWMSKKLLSKVKHEQEIQEMKAATGHLEQIKKCCPDGMHSQVLRELADTTAGLLAVVLEQSWQSGEMS